MQAAETVGLEVRSRVLRGGPHTLGGLVRLPGRQIVFMSSKATPVERCSVLAQALAELGHFAHPSLGPASRALVERRGRPEPPRTRGPDGAGPGPGLAGLGGHGRRRI
jgi:hypothetical protein